MRSAPSLVCLLVVATACNGPDGGTFPSERAPIRLVQCRPAQPLPTMSAELFASTRDSRYGYGGFGPGGGGRGVASPKLKLTITDVAIETGTFDPVAVRRSLTGRLPNLQTCYARDMASPSLKAKSLKLRFTIMTSGTITGVREIANGRITTPACVRNILEGSSIGTAPRSGSVLVSVTLRAEQPGSASEPRPAAAVGEPWTPFALSKTPPLETASLVARAAQSALRSKQAAIAACFQPTSPTGSLRLMLELGSEGELIASRAGGVGAKPIHDCMRKAVEGLKVVSPSSDAHEIACDFARGDAEPWRIATDAEYRVILASKAKIAHGNESLAAGAPAPEPLDDDGTYVIAVDPDVRGSILLLALSWAYEADATIVALRDPSNKQPPRFLGMGNTSLANADAEDEDAGIVPALRLGPAMVTACVNRTTQSAKLSEPGLVSALLQNVATKCRSLECTRTLVIALEPEAIAKDLVEVTGAARRAGFDRVLIGGDVCGGGKPAANPRDDDKDDDDDFDLDEEDF